MMSTTLHRPSELRPTKSPPIAVQPSSFKQRNRGSTEVEEEDFIFGCKGEPGYSFTCAAKGFPINLTTPARCRWPTAAHYLVGQRFAGAREYQLMVCRLVRKPNIHDVIKCADDHSHLALPDSPPVSEDAMYEVVKAKFAQHPDLARQLLETGDATLRVDARAEEGGDVLPVEAHDNALGRVLMIIREELRAAMYAAFVDQMSDSGSSPHPTILGSSVGSDRTRLSSICEDDEES